MLVIPTPRVQAAEVLIGLNGARPASGPILGALLEYQGFTQQGWLDYAARVGAEWLPGRTSIALDYPAQLGPLWGPGALTGDQSIAVGQQVLHTAILAEVAKGNTVLVTGGSMGTLVIDKELAYLRDHPDEVPASAVTFYLFGGESRGVGEMYLRGVTVPLLGITFAPVPETQYDIEVVYSQWDGLANPPDRPWHLLAVINALMGVVYTVDRLNDHSEALVSSREGAVLVSQTTNTMGGTTTTYMIPKKQLPITRPLLQLGVPRQVVDVLDRILTPVISAGYSTMTPHLGPHFEQGRLVFPRLAALAGQAAADEPSALTSASTVASGTTVGDPAGDPTAPKTPADLAEVTDEAAGTGPEPGGQSTDGDERQVSAPDADLPVAADDVPDGADSADDETSGRRATDPPEMASPRVDGAEREDGSRRSTVDVGGPDETGRAAEAEERAKRFNGSERRKPAGLEKPAEPRKQERGTTASSGAADARAHGKPATGAADG